MPDSGVAERLGQIVQWQRDHEKHDDARFTEISEKLDSLPRKEDIEEIVRAAMLQALLGIGKGTKVTILTVASLVAALAVISGGLKWVLATIGIGFIAK